MRPPRRRRRARPRAKGVEALLMRHGERRGARPRRSRRATTSARRRSPRATARSWPKSARPTRCACARRTCSRSTRRSSCACPRPRPSRCSARCRASSRSRARPGTAIWSRRASSCVRSHKARWNLLHGFRAIHELAPVERRAYYGWQALHAERLPIAQRIRAIEGYIKAGGTEADEALGVLLFRQRENDLASPRIRGTRVRRNDSLRLRNYLLAARAGDR